MNKEILVLVSKHKIERKKFSSRETLVPFKFPNKRSFCEGGGRSSLQSSQPSEEVLLLFWSRSRHHLLRGNSSASPPIGGQEGAQKSNLKWELLHTAKRGGLSFSMEGLEGVEEQRRRGKKGLKLLLSKVKVLLLSLSRTIIVCGFRFYDQCLMRARWSRKYSQCPNKPNSES